MDMISDGLEELTRKYFTEHPDDLDKTSDEQVLLVRNWFIKMNPNFATDPIFEGLISNVVGLIATQMSRRDSM